MKLDRHKNTDGLGKYALLKLRNYPDHDAPGREAVDKALSTLSMAGMLDTSPAGTEGEFFVIRLKDKYAGAALHSYATAAVDDDPEYAVEVMNLTKRAGANSPWCKKPD